MLASTPKFPSKLCHAPSSVMSWCICMAIPWMSWHHSAVSLHMACSVACCSIATSTLQAVSNCRQWPKPGYPPFKMCICSNEEAVCRICSLARSSKSCDLFICCDIETHKSSMQTLSLDHMRDGETSRHYPFIRTHSGCRWLFNSTLWETEPFYEASVKTGTSRTSYP